MTETWPPTTLEYAAELRQRDSVPMFYRRPAVVLAAAAAAILAGAAMAYAGLAGMSGAPAARAGAPGVAVSVLPSDGPLRLDPALPGVAPIASPGPSAAASAPASAEPEATTTEPPRDDDEPARPGRPPVAEPADPLPSRPEPEPSAPQEPLTATLTHVEEGTDQGYLGYAGTVRIDNPGGRDRTGWRLTLTVPGGSLVEGTGVSVAQDGEAVTFTPAGEATVPAGGSVTFSFCVPGTLPALPAGCAIDGNPCS